MRIGSCPECGYSPLSADVVECPKCSSRSFVVSEKYQKMTQIVTCPQCQGLVRLGTDPECDFCGGKRKVTRYVFSVLKRDLRTGATIFKGFEYEYSPL